MSILAGAHAAATESVGAEAIFTAGARAGIRRNVHGNDDNGNSQYGSIALTLGYARAVVENRGATNELGLVVQWEPLSNYRDVQWYLLGGPVASIDDDDMRGLGWGVAGASAGGVGGMGRVNRQADEEQRQAQKRGSVHGRNRTKWA